MLELTGHFHPLIVHLPIGILLVALFLQWLTINPKHSGLKPAVAIVLLAGVITALLSVLTGLALSKSDDYDQGLVNWHMWFAFAVLGVAAVLYTKEVNPKIEISKKLLSIGLFVLISITGHLGGSLTHGSDYLTKPFANIFNRDSATNNTIKPLPNVQEALVYANVVQPILETKCYSCHNANKRKGGLRMDDMTLLMKGGKNGKVIDLQQADSSEMLKRILLPVDNEEHMPPKEKPQPTESQIALLHWWVVNKADFSKKVKDLEQPDKIKPLLSALQKPTEVKVAPITPAEAVEKADKKVLDELAVKGIMALPVSQSSNYLSVNFVEKSQLEKTDIQLLEKIKKQLIWLKLDNKKMSDESVMLLAKLTNLRRLNLSGTIINDKALQAFNQLDKLEYLNLTATNISASGLLPLQKIKKLKNLFVYNTRISSKDYASLKKVFPATIIDTGNYVVPLFPTDTAIITLKK